MNKNTLLLKKFLKDTSIVNKPRTHPSPDWNFQQIETFHQTYKLNSTLDKYPRSFNNIFLRKHEKNEINDSNRNSHLASLFDFQNN